MHKPLVNLSSIQKDNNYFTTQVFSKLPLYIKKLLHDKVHFHNTFRHYLLVHNFHFYQDTYHTNQEITNFLIIHFDNKFNLYQIHSYCDMFISNSQWTDTLYKNIFL
jgi:hypothetical protein